MTSNSALSPVSSTTPWKELLFAAALSVSTALLAGFFDFHEALYAFTRRWEKLQLDELPLALMVFACCVLLLYVRRFGQVHAALIARRSAEQALGAALAENRELARQHLALQESERKHLARELHDELGQYLNAIKIDAVAVMQSNLDATQLTAAGERIVSCADHVHGALSDMIRRLRPVGLDELGLSAALEHCIGQWRQRLPGLQVTLSRRGELDGLGESHDLAVYRLVQEALTNASRHGRPTRIDVRIERLLDSLSGGERLDVSIVDDGSGMDAAQLHEGFGLRGMRERVELLGGKLSLHSTPDSGVAVVASLPLAGVAA